MPIFSIKIIDRNDKVETIRFAADNEAAARNKVLSDDEKLCRNQYVILKNVRYFERQIIGIELVEYSKMDAL